MPTSTDYFAHGSPSRHRGREVAGPYRSQSSVPAIRHRATRHEHRRVNPLDQLDHRVAPVDNPLAVPDISQPHAPSPMPHLAGLLQIPRRWEDPENALQKAAFGGVMPPAILRHEWRRDYGPGVYKAVEDAALSKIASQEGLKEDPLAELAISSLATAGLGAGVNALRGAATGAAAGVAADAGASAADSSLTRRLLEGALSLRSAAGREAAAARVKAAPQAVREGIDALGTAEGRRAAAKGSAAFSGRQLQSHPLAGGTGILAALHRAGIEAPLGKQADALVTGHLAALMHPGKTLPTTARALAGIVAAPAALGYSAGESVVEGSPDPFLNTAGGQLAGLEQMAGHLLSGNPDEVQRAVEDETGLSFLVPIPALTRLGRYKELRGAVRDAAKGLREQAAARYGLPLRHGPGEQHVFGPLERRAQRRDVAQMVSNETLPSRLQAAKAERPIVKAARKIPGARSLRNLHGPEGGDLIQTLADYGITSPEQLRVLRERGPVSDAAPRPGDINLRAVLDLADQHPEMLRSPALWEAVDAYRAQTEQLPANIAGNGERAAALPQAQLFGIRPPEDRVPHAARQFTEAADRQGAWRDLRASEKKAKSLRTEARLKLAASNAHALEHGAPTELARLHGVDPVAERARLREEGKALYVEARKLEEKNREFRRALHPFSRPGSAVSSRARRKLWDKALVDEFVSEVNAKAAEHGMVPGVYTHHAPLRQEGEVAPQARFGNAATRVQHVRRADEFSLAATDTVDRSLRGLLAGSIEGPRIRAAGQQLARRFFSKYSTPVKIGEATRRRVTQAEFAEAIRTGQVSEDHYVWVPEAQYKQAYVDPNVSPERYAAEAHAALRGELVDPKTGLPLDRHGAKGVIVPKEAFKEYAAQINPTRTVADRFVNTLSKGAGRILLFSPAWVESQIIAEGLPIVMSNPRLLNPLYVRKLDKRLKEWNDVSPNEAMGFAAVMGEAPVRAATPNELRPFQSSSAHQLFYDAARAVEHNPIGRALFSTARLRPFVLFDQWRHGKYQKILAAAEVDRRLNGFLSGLQGVLVHEKRLSEELKGMSPQEQLHALTQPRYKRDLDKIQNYVEAITGNWTAFTRFERFFSPAAVFYGFIRYAFRWPLTFAKHHPAAATVAYFLGQQNANQIEKILHGKPTEFYQYANPVVENGAGEKSVLPGGARIAPGLSAPAQNVLGGSAPAAAVGSLNPLYAALVGLVTGTDSFGRHDENEGPFGLHFGLAAKQLMSMPPIARYFGLGESHSPTAERLHELDPQRKERSLFAPWLPQSAHEARESAETIRAIENEDQGGSASSGSPLDQLDSALEGGANPLDQLDKQLQGLGP